MAILRRVGRLAVEVLWATHLTYCRAHSSHAYSVLRAAITLAGGPGAVRMRTLKRCTWRPQCWCRRPLSHRATPSPLQPPEQRGVALEEAGRDAGFGRGDGRGGAVGGGSVSADFSPAEFGGCAHRSRLAEEAAAWSAAHMVQARDAALPCRMSPLPAVSAPVPGSAPAPSGWLEPVPHLNSSRPSLLC